MWGDHVHTYVLTFTHNTHTDASTPNCYLAPFHFVQALLIQRLHLLTSPLPLLVP